LDALEINGSRTANANQEARTAAETMGLPLIGGSDSHRKTQVGACATEFPVRISTMDELIECVKRGHCKPFFLGQPKY
jgi:hypothetical protein